MVRAWKRPSWHKLENASTKSKSDLVAVDNVYSLPDENASKNWEKGENGYPRGLIE
jgi:hypothetical protein